VDDPVKRTAAPNGPLAEVLCQKPRDYGIPAFYRATSPWGSGVNNSLDPAFPARSTSGRRTERVPRS
jgi:hypothetical protein